MIAPTKARWLGVTNDRPYEIWRLRDVDGAVPYEKMGLIKSEYATTPALRATSPQGEAKTAHLEGSCRQSRLKGGFAHSKILFYSKIYDIF